MATLDSRALQLQISASSELLIRNLKTADQAIVDFRRQTETSLTRLDNKFAVLGKPLERLKSTIGSGALVGGLVGVLGGTTLVEVGRKALNYASSLGEVSQQLAVTTKDLQVYRYAASQVGIEQETIDRSLAKLTQTMGKAELGADGPRKAFAAIGISIDQLKGKTAGDVIPQIADVLGRIPDPAKRAAIEIALFGKAGQQLDTLLAGGSGQIDQLSRAAKDLGLVLSDEQIQNADRTADKLSELKQVLEARIAGIVAENAASIYNLASGIATLAGEVTKFLSTDPDRALAIIAALAGGAVAGPVGAAAAAVGTYTYRRLSAGAREDAETSPAFRKQKLDEALATYREVNRPELDAGSAMLGGRDRANASAELRKQIGLSREIIANRRKAAQIVIPRPANDFEPKQFLASGGSKSGKKATPKDPLANLDRNTNGALNNLRADIDPAGDFRAAMDELNQAVQGARERLDDTTTERFSRPLAAYRQQLQETVGDMSKAWESVAANGLYAVENGLAGVISGTESVGQAFKRLAQSIISDLARIGIEKGILGLLGGATGGGGGILSSLLGGKRAAGGPVDRGSLYLVGERGPELFAPGASGNIIPNHALRSPSLGNLAGRGAGGGTFNVTVNAPGADPNSVRNAVMEGMRQAVRVSAEHTNDSLAAISRPRL